MNKSSNPISDEQIKELLIELFSDEEQIYGYRKMAKCLRIQHNLIINKKKVYRLCKELGILKKQRQLIVKHLRKLARNRTITNANQFWEIDIKYGYILMKTAFSIPYQ